MFSTSKFCGLLVAISALAGVCSADSPLINRDCTKVTCPPSRYCCPDDYVCKPLPTTCPSTRGCVDDYCAKPLPTTCPSPRGCVDDYCPKLFPKCLPGCFPAWFTCGPRDCGPCNSK